MARTQRYTYDPLDRLIGTRLDSAPPAQRFYNREHLSTELQGAVSHSLFQQASHLLAQKSLAGKTADTVLLATNAQRSVLQGMSATQSKTIAYNAYGHHPILSGLQSLLAFNGERPDPLTGHYLLGNGHRAYNSVLMRFNSPDRLSPFGDGGLNPYAYCVGDPVNRMDPSGRFSITWLASVIGFSSSALALLPSMGFLEAAKRVLKGPVSLQANAKIAASSAALISASTTLARTTITTLNPAADTTTLLYAGTALSGAALTAAGITISRNWWKASRLRASEKLTEIVVVPNKSKYASSHHLVVSQEIGQSIRLPV